MGLAAGLAAGGAALGLISGAGGSEQTTTRNVAPPSQRERDLQEQSFQNYLQQLQLAQQQEAGIQGGAGLQEAARGGIESILNGQSFAATPEEEARINQYRQALVDQGAFDVQNLINQNVQRLTASAADRGVRGQALSELQSQGINSGAQQLGSIVRQANVTAAQQLMDNPYRRAQLQGSLANQNANFMENLRQQAIQNRQQLQNPALMQTLQNERLAAAGSTTVQPGSLGGAIGGALGGAGSLLSAGAAFKKIT